MIGAISGKLAYKANDHVLIESAGVGYLVYCTEHHLAGFPECGVEISLYTSLLVQENNLQLFGFSSLYEKEWHELLISVSGIGAKASLALLNTLGADGVAHAIALGDWHSIRSAPGIGPKIAQRVTNELRDKAPAILANAGDTTVAVASGAVSVPAKAEDGPEGNFADGDRRKTTTEAISALSNLGYTPAEAASAVAQALDESDDWTVPNIIRVALRKLVRQ